MTVYNIYDGMGPFLVFTSTNGTGVVRGRILHQDRLADVPGVHKLVDNILVYGNDLEELHRIRLVFERCQEWGITLSNGKYQVGPVEHFAGYVVSEEGTMQDPKLVEAISGFPAPKDLTNLRSLMGLVNQFNDSNPDLKQAMAS